ncbi:MAG: hypothetical protein NTW19_14155 [Planctomycetota bacterium]|nr:hypothetical protein [Planctomycetota bacterium]
MPPLDPAAVQAVRALISLVEAHDTRISEAVDIDDHAHHGLARETARLKELMRRKIIKKFKRVKVNPNAPKPKPKPKHEDVLPGVLAELTRGRGLDEFTLAHHVATQAVDAHPAVAVISPKVKALVVAYRALLAEAHDRLPSHFTDPKTGKSHLIHDRHPRGMESSTRVLEAINDLAPHVTMVSPADRGAGDSPTSERSYSTDDLCSMLERTSPTVNKYAKKAGVNTAGRGGKMYRYPAEDTRKILRWVIEHVVDRKLVSHLKTLLPTIGK